MVDLNDFQRVLCDKRARRCHRVGRGRALQSVRLAMLSPPPANGGSAWWLQSGEFTSASNLQHEIGCRMRQLSLSGQPDMQYFVDHSIDSPAQSPVTLRRTSSFRDDGARYRVRKKLPPQTIYRSPMDAQQIRC
jgi:hypothetical protein